MLNPPGPAIEIARGGRMRRGRASIARAEAAEQDRWLARAPCAPYVTCYPRRLTPMRFFVFFTVLLAIMGALGVYIHRRAALALNLSSRGRRALGVLLAAGLLAMPAGRLARGYLPDGALRGLALSGWLVLVGA